jgi:hypothetical protein
VPGRQTDVFRRECPAPDFYTPPILTVPSDSMGIYQTVLDQWGIPYDAPLPLLQRPQARDRLINRKPQL